MVNDELSYEINGDDKDQEQSTYPREEIDSHENAGKQAIDKGLVNSPPLPTLYVVEG